MKPQLKQCQDNFSRWRHQNPGRKQPPKSLKVEAVALLSHYSAEELSIALKVPFSTLKSWRCLAQKNVVDFITLPAPVEVLTPLVTAAAPFDCHINLGNGVQLTFTPPSVEAIAQLIHSFIREPLSCSI